MSAVTATLAGRRAAEALMVDACTITTPGSPATNDTTGVVTNTPTTKYTGRCKLQRPSGDGRREVAEASVVVAPLELHLPVVGSEGLAEGDVVTVTASAARRGPRRAGVPHRRPGPRQPEDRPAPTGDRGRVVRVTVEGAEELAAAWDEAAGRADEELRPVVSKGALNIKNATKAKWAGHRHAPTLAAAVSYDPDEEGGALGAEIGPDKAAPAAARSARSTSTAPSAPPRSPR
jgi:hypothetical protein